MDSDGTPLRQYEVTDEQYKLAQQFFNKIKEKTNEMRKKQMERLDKYDILAPDAKVNNKVNRDE